MPSFQDSAFIILLGLLLFGPKGLAKIARQLGKLVGEFRRASAEFRMQMEDELRVAEQNDQQKKIEAMQAAAPVAPLIPSDIPEPEHPHMPPPEAPATAEAAAQVAQDSLGENHIHEAPARPEPLPIATSGDLNLMPPATGLPVGRSASSTSIGAAFDAIPRHESRHEPAPESGHDSASETSKDEQEVPANG